MILSWWFGDKLSCDWMVFVSGWLSSGCLVLIMIKLGDEWIVCSICLNWVDALDKVGKGWKNRNWSSLNIALLDIITFQR